MFGALKHGVLKIALRTNSITPALLAPVRAHSRPLRVHGDGELPAGGREHRLAQAIRPEGQPRRQDDGIGGQEGRGCESPFFFYCGILVLRTLRPLVP